MGGSTFDASPVSYRDGIYEVKDAGDTHLGGRDFENRIADVSSQDFKRSTIAKNTEAVVSERTGASGLSPTIAKAIQYARTDANGPNAEMHR